MQLPVGSSSQRLPSSLQATGLTTDAMAGMTTDQIASITASRMAAALPGGRFTDAMIKNLEQMANMSQQPNVSSVAMGVPAVPGAQGVGTVSMLSRGLHAPRAPLHLQAQQIQQLAVVAPNLLLNKAPHGSKQTGPSAVPRGPA